VNKKLLSRYFELNGHYLKYFEDKSKDNTEENLEGLIDLSSLRFCTVDDCNIFLELEDDVEIKVQLY
jgi:hypothetical protein